MMNFYDFWWQHQEKILLKTSLKPLQVTFGSPLNGQRQGPSFVCIDCKATGGKSAGHAGENHIPFAGGPPTGLSKSQGLLQAKILMIRVFKYSTSDFGGTCSIYYMFLLELSKAFHLFSSPWSKNISSQHPRMTCPSPNKTKTSIDCKEKIFKNDL